MRHCKNKACGKELVRRTGENISNFKVRKHCNSTCAGAAKRQVKKGVCQYEECGREFEMGAGQWNRMYCGPECQRASRQPAIDPDAKFGELATPKQRQWAAMAW